MKTDRPELFFHLLTIALILVSLWPVVFMLSASFKDLSQVFSSPLNPFPYPPTLDNYID
ncbi:MAG TPA: carbohydrate ABC transporter permease, partial [Acidaminococcaceae bacterium]|nr:carbohydrate ABC transporter permease [Acidaminococcaceae bacterium]